MVQDVVDRDGTEEAALGIDYGHGNYVVGSEPSGNFGARQIHRNGFGHRIETQRQGCCRGFAEQPLKTHRTQVTTRRRKVRCFGHKHVRSFGGRQIRITDSGQSLSHGC